MRQGLSEPEFYGDLVFKLKKIVGSNNFSAQFIKIISHYQKIGYNINVLQQTACLVVNPITVGNFAGVTWSKWRSNVCFENVEEELLETWLIHRLFLF